ncbi:MAG: Ser-tRNA(Thr) hydrolase / threonyl-tRNA synthetase [Acidobacteriaceae bacterium]|nr:Ser-tRNA(Thr) hydrolase / threonyl-tRNA synthetase [Acidobacteriaceae bacterium]
MSENIHIKLPDGSEKEVPKGATALDVAKSISPRLADAAIAAKAKPLHRGNGPSSQDQSRADPSASSGQALEGRRYTQDQAGEGARPTQPVPPQSASDGDLIDLTRPLDKDTDLRILTEKDPEALGVYRHSSAHLLAAAVLELFPETKLGHGPATESGFFYDFYRPTPFTPEDLEKIEKKMQELVQQNLPYAREFLPRDEGLQRFKSEGDFMKCHFIEQFTRPDEKISIYKTGKFLDFCRGPHIPSTGKIKAFKLLNIAGAYWLGDEKNPQLQRIYGTSFFSKKDLDNYLHQIEEAKKRDHRVLGKQLDLFSIQELAGPGLIFWHPKGGIIRKEMEDWMRDQYIKRGYSLVYTPHVMRKQLWQTSGHEGYYSQNMFDVMELDDAEYRLKPMNCPGHILIYKDSLKSYRDLPVRLSELGTVYRYERSGVMHGLLRVRGFTQDDAHIFCTPEQIEKEIADCVEFARDVLKDFGFDQFVTELSTWDPAQRASFVGSEEQWNTATASLEKVLKRLGIEYKTIPGEAAFYGPKIDIKLVDAIGRLWQLSTVQFDFNLPARFGLEYVAEDGTRKQPVMVHRALYGSIERFFGVLIEHYAGAFPVWLSPVQVVLIPIAERHVEYANKVAAMLRGESAHVGAGLQTRPAEPSSAELGVPHFSPVLRDVGSVNVRVEVDAHNEKMNAKIREHAMQKVPFMLVVGDKEAEAGKVNVRTRGKEKTEDMSAEEFGERVRKLIAEKTSLL